MIEEYRNWTGSSQIINTVSLRGHQSAKRTTKPVLIKNHWTREAPFLTYPILWRTDWKYDFQQHIGWKFEAAWLILEAMIEK